MGQTAVSGDRIGCSAPYRYAATDLSAKTMSLTKTSASISGDFKKLDPDRRTDVLQRMLSEKLLAKSSESEIPKRGVLPERIHTVFAGNANCSAVLFPQLRECLAVTRRA